MDTTAWYCSGNGGRNRAHGALAARGGVHGGDLH